MKIILFMIQQQIAALSVACIGVGTASGYLLSNNAMPQPR